MTFFDSRLLLSLLAPPRRRLARRRVVRGLDAERSPRRGPLPRPRLKPGREARPEGTGGQQTSCGTGACSSTGQKECQNGQLVDTCSPGSPSSESCNNVDDDCDGRTDEGVTKSCGQSTGQCEKGTQYCSQGRYGTCRGNVGPSPETCDGKDNDCDGSIDEGVKTTYYKDDDGDGYGETSDRQKSCSDPGSKWVTKKGDCNDRQDEANPGAQEACIPDGSGGFRDTDYDCDGQEHECCTPRPYYDGDEDGYGGSSHPAFWRCPNHNSSTVVDQSGDCNDNDASINPRASEKTGDEIDQNCDGDESCYNDFDEDGYGNSVTVVSSDIKCQTSDGESTRSGDCEDTNDKVNPGVTDYKESGYGPNNDKFDYNCDGVVEKRWTALDPSCPKCSIDKKAWTDSDVPDCGQFGNWGYKCENVPGSNVCRLDSTFRTQECR